MRTRAHRVLQHGKRVLVTGASSGIGYELAWEFARRGSAVVVVARREKRLRDLGAALTAVGLPAPLILAADLSAPGQAREVGRAAIAELGGIDVLVNNAGAGIGGLQWAAADGAAARALFEVNVWSPLALIGELIPGMRERRRGAVINVTSIAQVTTWPLFGHYAATKAALASLTETLRMELIQEPIHVMEVIPGPVSTAVQGESRLVGGFEEITIGVQMGDPAVLAKRTVDALARRERRVLYPRPVQAAYSLPWLVRWQSPRRLRKLADRIAWDDARVRISGSSGDPIARRAREAWERGERDFKRLRDEAHHW